MVEYEDRLKLKGHDFSILDKFEFKYTPVGFKFFNDASDHKGLELEKLDKKIASFRIETGIDVKDVQETPQK